MLLSFSVPEMLPYIEAGIRQAQGEDIGAARVKRQTIRRRGKRYDAMLAAARRSGWWLPADLHLWWKSRRPERRHLGTIKGVCRIYPVTILHSFTQSPSGPKQTIYRIDGPRGWRDGDGDDMLFWSPGAGEHSGFAQEAFNDGFESPQDFCDYFVPNMGDCFEGALLRW